MPSSKPRISPLEESQWDDQQRDVVSTTAVDGRVLNVFKTLVRHPKLLKRWLVFANHVLFKTTLPPRDRELLILRIGWLCRAEYEWGQHVRIAAQCGISEEEIRRVAAGPAADGWEAFEAALLRAVDELRADAIISDTTWQTLADRYNTQQLMDLVFTIGQYNLVSMALNTFGVEREPGLAGFAETT